MSQEKEGAATQAQKWVQTLKSRAAAITGFEQAGAVNNIVQKLEVDFPNQVYALVDRGVPVGSRRVFGDRSYCDLMFADESIGRITFGVMSAGLLGTAQNGRTIQ
jgi:hypothetical protein